MWVRREISICHTKWITPAPLREASAGVSLPPPPLYFRSRLFIFPPSLSARPRRAPGGGRDKGLAPSTGGAGKDGRADRSGSGSLPGASLPALPALSRLAAGCRDMTFNSCRFLALGKRPEGRTGSEEKGPLSRFSRARASTARATGRALLPPPCGDRAGAGSGDRTGRGTEGAGLHGPKRKRKKKKKRTPRP